MFTAVKVEEAVGMILAHDITEVRPGEFKGASFQRGHRIEASDLCHLMRLGKRHIYILDVDEDHLHEDEAALMMARSLAGSGVIYDDQPREGKVGFTAAYDGLFKVNVNPLTDLNLIPDVMCACIHTNTPVKKGGKLAGTRAIPLVVSKTTVGDAVELALNHYPMFSVKRFNPLKCSLIITGSEVYEGLIEDRFEPIAAQKLETYGASLKDAVILPDDASVIAETVDSFLDQGAEMIITTGGMSVDPDDVTRAGIRKVGIDRLHYGAAVLPGAMFLLGYKGDIPVVGIPACGLFHERTIFDLVLPRLLVGEKPGRKDLAQFAHGGMCLDCSQCRFPACSFGK